ncbi:MAG: FkbM family methyltransferase [Treponema sp.]|nr:FkbM family methyltransferase [Treponema sp.]
MLKEDLLSVNDYSEKKILQIKKSGLPVVIWGLGGMISFIVKNFQDYGVKIDYIIENNISKCGGKFNNIDIISFQDLKLKLTDCNILIGVVTKKYVSEIKKQIKDDGQFTNVYFFEMFYPFGNTAKNRVFDNLKKIQTVIDMLDDEESKVIFEKKIHYMLSKSEGVLAQIQDFEDNQYFDKRLIDLSYKDGVFLDGGAFHGENTIEMYKRFPNTLLHSVCIDADSENIKYMKTRTKELNNSEILYAALSSKNGIVHFVNSGDRGGMVSNDEEGNIISAIGIDDTFSDKKIAFIKLDIEGYELECIIGAENIIKRDKPILAICIYHSIEDHWDIPLLIKKICPSYKLYVRHYHYMGIETVLYAI